MQDEEAQHQLALMLLTSAPTLTRVGFMHKESPLFSITQLMLPDPVCS